MIRSGLVDFALTGGSEAPFSLGSLKGWEAVRVMAPDTCRPFSRDRKGMVLGEGAGLQVVVAAPRDLGELACETALLGGEVEDLDAGGNDFLADAVAGDNRDAMSLHLLSAEAKASALRMASVAKNAMADAMIPLSAGSTQG